MHVRAVEADEEALALLCLDARVDRREYFPQSLVVRELAIAV